LVEAALARAPLCIPYFNQCRRADAELMFVPGKALHSAACLFPGSPEEFIRCVADCARQPRMLIDPMAAQTIVREFFFLPESGTISERVEAFISRHLPTDMVRRDIAAGAPPARSWM
jgi:hypothetical protein